MAGRFVVVAGGLLLAAGVSAFVAERAGWFDPADVRDALPGIGAPDRTLPADPAEEAAPAPERRPPETAVARPARKPAPDVVAPIRKPDLETEPPIRTAQGEPAPERDEGTPATGTTPEPADQGTDGAAPVDGAADDRTETERTAEGRSDDGRSGVDGSGDGGAKPSAVSNGEADGTGSERAASTAAEPPAPAEPTDAQAAEADGDSDPTADRAQASAPRDDTAGEADAPAVRDPDSGMQLTVPARDGEAEAPAGATVAKVPTPQIPSFDIVRVERSGEAVIAGRAAPRSRVTVLQGDEPIATTQADDRGEFVAIPHRPLPPGQRPLTLRAEDPESGATTESDRAVVIDIPRMPDDETPEAAETTRTADRPDEGGQGGAQVAVRDNRPTADPPLLADRSQAADGSGEQGDRTDAGAGEGSQTAGQPLTVPAPPDEAATNDASPATVTDVPKPAGAGPEVRSQTAESAPDAGPSVTARQDRGSLGDGADPTATRALRPRAAARPSDDGSTGAGDTDDDRSGQVAEAPTRDGARDRGDSPIAVLVPREGTGEVEVLQRPSGETGLQNRELVLEAVQYTVDGGISITGRAPSEAMVVAFLNDTELARVRTPADGDWTMAPDADVPPGLHTLRVDQLGPKGEVQASVSTPFANQPMVDELDQNEGMVVIQPGDNLWTIARRTYGQGWEYTLIYRANRDQIRDPDLIYPGQVFVVPEEQRRGAAGGE